jgi:hypothetical protein
MRQLTSEPRICKLVGCEATLEGRRRGTEYCSPSHRVRAFKARTEGRDPQSISETPGTAAVSADNLPQTRNGKYTAVEVETGLRAVAMASGNATRAAEVLERSGQRAIPRRTLSKWATETHAERYRQISQDILPELDARLAEGSDALVQAYSELQWEAIERAREKLPEAKVSELASLMKAGAVGTGIHTEKSQLRRGQPTEIKKQDADSVHESLKRVARRWPQFINPAILEGLAVEVTVPRRELPAPSRDD